jgi:O-antigen/teichoic acid export membrane protein
LRVSTNDRGSGLFEQLRRRLSRPGLTREGLITYGFTGIALVANLATGVLVARLLGPSGRGQITAIANAAAWLSLFFLVGSREAIAYHQARHPEQGGRLFSTWILIMIPASVLGILVSELLLPLLFSAQTSETTRLGMLYLLAGIPLVLLSERLQGFLLGDHDFLFWNITRVALPGLTMVAYIALWGFDAFTVESALITLIAAGLIVCAASSVRILRRHGFARPSRAIGKTTVWYGLRGSAGDALALLNSRLDLLILPAFVGAASVGYYSVATNVSWIIFMIASPLMSLVLPVAARRGEKGPATVIKAMHLTLVAGTAFAVVVGLLAGIAVKAVYGADFGPSVEPLRILLPGTVLYGGAMVIVSGLYGAGRPFTAGVPQILGLVITGAGLGLFLQSGGIDAAATVSTASYTLVFIISAILYKRATGLRWGAFVPSFGRGSAGSP